MKQITLAQARNYNLGGLRSIGSPNPYDKTIAIQDGTSISPFASWDSLKERYGLEIVLTKEEEEMVERGRLVWTVQAKAKELGAAIDAWLLNEKAR